MRRVLMVGTAVAMVTAASPAYALFGVGDVVIDPTAIANQVKQLANEAQDHLSWINQAQQMYQEYQQLQAVYGVLSHPNGLGSVVSAMNMLGIQNPLPVNAWSVQQLMSGQGGVSGNLGALSGLFNTNFNANHVYSSNDGSFLSGILGSNANSIAGVQSLAQQLYGSMSTRLSNMQGLQAKLAASTDVKETADIQAQLAIEQNNIQAQQAQAQALALMQAANLQNQRQQVSEQRQKEIDDLLADAAAHGYH
jgi:type IV secretion system protein VirB5